MKKISLLVTLLCMYTGLLFAQAPDFPIDPQTKKITYKGDVPVSSAVKMPALFNRAKAWGTAKKYTITALKKDKGVFAGTGSFAVSYPSATKGKTDSGNVNFLLTITCKDGKYSYVITDFTHTGLKGRGDGGVLEAKDAKCGIYTLPHGSWVKIKEQTVAEVEKIIADMKDGMNGKIAAK